MNINTVAEILKIRNQGIGLDKIMVRLKKSLILKCSSGIKGAMSIRVQLPMKP